MPGLAMGGGGERCCIMSQLKVSALWSPHLEASKKAVQREHNWFLAVFPRLICPPWPRGSRSDRDKRSIMKNSKMDDFRPRGR